MKVLFVFCFFIVLTVSGQYQAQLLIPQDFSIPSGSIKSEDGKGICLEINRDSPIGDSFERVTSQENVYVTIDSGNPLTLAEAISEGIISLVQYGYKEYYFEKASAYLNSNIEIQMKGSLGDFIVLPNDSDFNISSVPFRELNSVNFKIDGFNQDHFQNDIWWFQVQRELLEIPSAKFEISTRDKVVKHKKSEDFWEDFNRVVNDEEYCDSYISEVCINNGELPSVSFTTDCRTFSFTVSTDGAMTFERSVGNPILKISQGGSIEFSEDISNALEKENCTWDQLCFSFGGYVPVSLSTDGCDLNINVGNSLSVSFPTESGSRSYSITR